MPTAGPHRERPAKSLPRTPELRGKFAEIWIPWLRSTTGKEPEPEDLLAVGDPESFYVKDGGAVLFALQGPGPARGRGRQEPR